MPLGMKRSYAGPEMKRSYAGPEMKRSYAGPEMKRSYADPEMQRSYAGLATTRSYAAALSLVLLFTSCASAPMRHVYVLASSGESTTDIDAAGGSDRIQGVNADRIQTARLARIQVEPIAIPDYLDSTDIVMRHGAHEIVSSATGRWGDRLAEGLREALASDLSARLPHDFITTARDLDPLARQLLLTVSALDVWENGRCILIASWSIGGKGGASPILDEDTL